jgi:hypothetical protein
MTGNFVYNYIVRTNVVISSENATTAYSTGFDCSNADAIIGILALSSGVEVSSGAASSTAMSMHAAGGTVQSTASSDTYVDLTGTSVVPTTASDNLLVCEVTHPQHRYVRFEIVGTTAIYSHLTVIRKMAVGPSTAPAYSVVEQHVSPTTGTA